MLNIKHKPTINFYNNYIVEVDSIDSAIKELIPRIRKQSQCFYTNNIREELEKKGNTIIDQHAGNGSFYYIILNKSYLQKSKQTQIW